MRESLDFIHSGKIGEVKFARAICYRLRNSIGLVDTPAPVPEGLDLDLWCGPAEKKVPIRKKFHYDWHWVLKRVTATSAIKIHTNSTRPVGA